jgi:hypothetical protein
VFPVRYELNFIYYFEELQPLKGKDVNTHARLVNPVI